MAKKTKSAAIVGLRSQIRATMKELDNIEKDLAKVQATLESFLSRPAAFPGEDDYRADVRALVRKKIDVKIYEARRRRFPPIRG